MKECCYKLENQKVIHNSSTIKGHVFQCVVCDSFYKKKTTITYDGPLTEEQVKERVDYIIENPDPRIVQMENR